MFWKADQIRILCALLLGCVGFLCSGQGYFNKLYPYGPVTYNVIETRNGYGTIGGYTGTPKQSLIIMEVDYSGNVTYTKIIDSLKGKFYVAFEGNLAEYPGGYAMAVHYLDTIDHEYLMLLDTNFRFKKFHEITGVDNRSFSKVIYHDGFFYITGHIFTNDYPDSLHRREALLIKVDTAGQIVYDKAYPNTSYQANKVINIWSHDVIPAADGGTYMAAWWWVDYLPGVNTKDSADFMILKVDSNGIKEKEYRFGNPSLRDPKVKLLPYSDSSILAFAAYPLSSNLDYPDYNTSNENRVYEVYDDGRPMQLLKTFGPRNRYQGPFGAMYLKNGNICLYGLNRVYQMDVNKYPGIVIGYTFVLSPDLDSINMQYHQSVNNSITDEHYLLDARPASDGGIIAGGYLSTDRSTLNNNFPGSHIWLVKLDSLGCATAGCENIGIEEPYQIHSDIVVYPNPAHRELKVLLPEAEEVNYSLLALDGKIVQQGVLRKRENSIDIEQQLSGVFLLRINMQAGVVVKKVIFAN